MWQFIKDIPNAVKIGFSIASGVITGVGATFAIMLGPVNDNVAAIERNSQDIETVQNIATSNLARLQYLDDKIDFLICNDNPDMTWQECELAYRRSGGSQP